MRASLSRPYQVSSVTKVPCMKLMQSAEDSARLERLPNMRGYVSKDGSRDSILCYSKAPELRSGCELRRLFDRARYEVH